MKQVFTCTDERARGGRRVRVALFSWETLHSIAVGGVGVHVTELAAGLRRRGHEVHVFTRQGVARGCTTGSTEFITIAVRLLCTRTSSMKSTACAIRLFITSSRWRTRSADSTSSTLRLARVELAGVDQGKQRASRGAYHALDGIRPQRQQVLRRPVPACCRPERHGTYCVPGTSRCVKIISTPSK